MVSHPAWVCGLKLMNQVGVHAVIASHPAWVCGLKQGTVPFDREIKEVTPCVGVWIETTQSLGNTG